MKQIFYLILFLPFGLSAQTKVDSFYLYTKQLKDSNTLNKLINYTYQLKDTEPDSAFKYAQIALNKSQQLGLKVQAARSLTNLGAIATATGRFAKALNYQTKALSYWEQARRMDGVAIIKSNMADVYSRMKNYEMQYHLLQEAVDIAEKYHAEKQLGLICTNLGNYFYYQGDYAKAISSFERAAKINKKFNNISILSIDYSNAGGALFMLGKMDKAINYYQLSLKLAQESGNKVQETYAYGNLGEAYEEKNLFKQAEAYYQLSNQIAKELNIKPSLSYNYGKLIGLKKKQGLYKEALEWMEKKNGIDDSLMNTQTNKQIAEMQTKYQTQEKQQQIALLSSQNTIQQLSIKRKNTLLIGLSIFFILMVLALFLGYSRRYYRQQAIYQTKLFQEKDLAAKALIDAEERERQRIAADLHDGIGQLFSTVKLNLSSLFQRIQFQQAEDQNLANKVEALVDESCKEVRSIAHQMMPNVLLRAGLASAIRDFIDQIDAQTLQIHLEINGLQERLDTDVETVLYRVLQECVNNVIKHAQATKLDIQLSKEEEGISLTIEDNGKGFEIAQTNTAKGVGMKNILSRVDYLKGSVDFSSTSGKGTLVAIYIPLVV